MAVPRRASERMHVDPGNTVNDHFCRRQFLSTGAAAAGAFLLGSGRALSDGPTLRIRPGAPLARVVQVSSPYIVNGPKVHRDLLETMLQMALVSVTGRATVTEAWHSILKPDDIIGIKFNGVGQRVMATSHDVSDALITSLFKAGWRPEQLVCLEAPAGVAERYGTTRPRTGFTSKPVDFGSGVDQFAAVLEQVTALINVPFLKTHNIARLTCALKNLSHGLVKHPARYHDHHCSPYVGDIVASAPIRSKLRLSLVDALRVSFDGGPEPTASTLHDSGSLLASFDPVAADTAGLAILNDIRQKYTLDPVARTAADIEYLASAHQRGLGVAAWHGIDLERIQP